MPSDRADETAPGDYGPLPESTKGWTMSMVMHLNYGRKGGGGVYRVRDAAGRETPVGYHYDTRKEAPLKSFFTLLGDPKQYATYDEARDAWNARLAESVEPEHAGLDPAQPVRLEARGT